MRAKNDRKCLKIAIFKMAAIVILIADKITCGAPKNVILVSKSMFSNMRNLMVTLKFVLMSRISNESVFNGIVQSVSAINRPMCALLTESMAVCVLMFSRALNPNPSEDKSYLISFLLKMADPRWRLLKLHRGINLVLIVRLK